jgi:glycosyltransferase involved in cell wall biosynthesis
MRVVFLCNSFWPNIGGAELVCKNIVDTLSKQHDVTVITQPAKNRSNSEYKLVEINAVTSYSVMSGLREKIKSLSPDIIISFGYGKSFSDVSSKFAKRNNIPFIFMPCGNFHTNKKAISKRLYGMFAGKTCFRNASKIITATEWEKQHWIKQYNISENKFMVIPYNLPKNFTKYKYSKITPTLSKKYYLYLGRNGPNKKIKELIEGYKLSKSKYPLYIVGKGTDCAEFKNIREKNICFFGQVTEDYKKHFIKHARALIFPSDYESFGMCLLETDAFNTPYMMSNIPPFKELSPNNEYVFENTPNSIARLLQKVDNIPELYSPTIKLPNFKKTFLELINSYENRNVL